ncbi:galactose-1-phosphate uridylyltransferase [Zavarzinella formosa]|uniref:galactose-1-phosphate uridylyltransferase n=1 Tax=Zavarzinella formosa TaxID=360055 RepID=UPI0002E82215|nr:DUF4931 domain-containing protein [Zavarzinella formosa]
MAQPVPEWRTDPVTGRRVLLSPIRAERPFHASGHCPFCEHHEDETTLETLAVRDPGSKPNGPGWQVRVVPNRYAAVRPDAAPHTPGLEAAPGVAEVFIEGPHHETHLHRHSAKMMRHIVRTWRDRLNHWREDGRFAFAQVFKNQGPTAGASLSHCHSQLIAVTEVPKGIRDEVSHIVGFDWNGWLASEQTGPRWIRQTDTLAELAPMAPRFPGETWIVPRQPSACFEHISNDLCDEVAETLHDLLNRIDRHFKSPDLNVMVRSAPFAGDSPNYRWRLEVLPRLVTPAGWEHSTGVLINPMLPETAAEWLRR